LFPAAVRCRIHFQPLSSQSEKPLSPIDFMDRFHRQPEIWQAAAPKAARGNQRLILVRKQTNIQKMEKTPETYDCHHKSTMDNRSRRRNFTV
jgi:hypothetical protein